MLFEDVLRKSYTSLAMPTQVIFYVCFVNSTITAFDRYLLVFIIKLGKVDEMLKNGAKLFLISSKIFQCTSFEKPL